MGGREGLCDRRGCQPIASEGSERGASCVTTVLKALGRESGEMPRHCGPSCTPAPGSRRRVRGKLDKPFRKQKSVLPPSHARAGAPQNAKCCVSGTGAGQRSCQSNVIDRRRSPRAARNELVQSERGAGLLGGPSSSGS